MSAALSKQLFELLDLEHEALITSNFSKLEQLSQKKEALSKAIQDSSSRLEASSIEKIRSKTEKNSQLFEANLKGIRAAIDKIEEGRHSFGQLKTYDFQGQLSTRRTLTPSVSKKA